MVERKSKVNDYYKRDFRLLNPYYMPYYPQGQLDNEEYARINKKRILLIISGVAFTVLTALIYIYLKLIQDPEESGHGMGEFCFIGLALVCNLTFWGVIFYAIEKLQDKSQSSFYTVLGAFLLAILPGILILGGLLMAGIIWYGYCILIIIVGLKALITAVKEKGFSNVFGALTIIILGFVIIVLFLSLKIKLFI